MVRRRRMRTCLWVSLALVLALVFFGDERGPVIEDGMNCDEWFQMDPDSYHCAALSDKGYNCEGCTCTLSPTHD